MHPTRRLGQLKAIHLARPPLVLNASRAKDPVPQYEER